MNDISPALRGEIERSFGTKEDMLRAIANAKGRTKHCVFLTAHRGERLQLSLDEHPQGTVIYSAQETWNGALVSARYRDYLARRPRRAMD